MTGEETYLTAEQVARRYGNAVSVGTLRNWRCAKPVVGPKFTRLGRAIVYPLSGLIEWERQNTVGVVAGEPGDS